MDKEGLRKLIVKVREYRGAVIHDFISIEAFISSIIAIYFAKKEKNNEFNRTVMDDEYFSFGLKINILEKLNLVVYNGFFEDIRRLNKIRNIFAHNIPTLDEGFYCYDKKDKKQNHKKMKELYEEFTNKTKIVDAQLDKIFSELVKKNTEVI